MKALLLSFTTLLGVFSAQAGETYWTNNLGGIFSTPSNWSPNVVPGPSDVVLFTNSGPYTFTFDVDATNSSAIFYQGTITQDISASVWCLTNEWRVGETAGSTSRVTAASGLLTVTNESGKGVLSVGSLGTGELAIRGGNVVSDLLFATNGGSSLLTLAHGSLTTLKGVTVNNGTLIVGLVTNAPFVWNIFGGKSQILNDGFSGYGGLTLGVRTGVGRSIINMAGSNTSLSVPGLDVYGNNSLTIQGGALFHTASVQWGLQTVGTNNVVTIADPGSAWLNDSLMYFGMHSDAQTMIITNGAHFRAAGSFDSLSLPNIRIIITGPDSTFLSYGKMSLGITYSSPVTPLSNLILVTNGGRFSAQQLIYGSTNIVLGSVSRPGNVIDVVDGSLSIETLDFGVGTLRLEAGTGTVNVLNMKGGTNALIQTPGNLYLGYHGKLSPGDLQVGAGNVSIPSLNGELHVGGWQMGLFGGDSGSVTMTGGRAFVTNSVGIGGSGNGTLRVNGGSIQANVVEVGSSAGSSGLLVLNGPTSRLSAVDLLIGEAGTVTVSNGATLNISGCFAPLSSISIREAALEFASATPTIPSDAVVTTNATISFRDVISAPVDVADPTYLGRVQRHGWTALQLINATNAPLTALVFRDSDASNWSRLILNGGLSAVQAGSTMIETNSSLAATNTIATISGSFTNRGQFLLSNSSLRFTDNVTLSETCGFQGAQGFLFFAGGLHLPAMDVVVPSGVAVQASSITSDGGQLVVQGGAIIPNDDGTVPDGVVIIGDSWVTYMDTPAAPLVPPVGLSGALGLELIRSTNAFVTSSTFSSLTKGYERLRMGADSCWQSAELVIGREGGMYLAAPSASITLTSGVFTVEQGGLFRDDTGRTSDIGFSSTVSNVDVTVSGIGSTWLTTNTLSLGAGGSMNQLRVDHGGTLFANSATIGGTTGHSNRIVLNGAGARFFATNGLTIAGRQNQFLITTGAVFSGSQILANGFNAAVSLVGTGAFAVCSNQIMLSGAPSLLQVTDGANLSTSNGTLASSIGSKAGSRVDVSGEGSLWRMTGGLTINPAQASSATNLVVISNKGSIVSPSLSLTSYIYGQAALSIQGGQLFITNSAGTANFTVNGPLDLNRGFIRANRLTASSASSSVINIRAGTAEWAACDLSTGIPLRIGDGTNLATLNLLGGTNVCRSGVEVRRYSRLTGTGHIIGDVTNRGSLWPSAITIRNNLVLDPSSDLAYVITGPPGSQGNGSLIVTGSVSVAGNLAISLTPGAIVSSSESFDLLQYGSIDSSFSNVAFGQRLLTLDRLGSFRIDDTGTKIIATDFRSEDLDGDGIQDAWAIQYFGFSPLLPGTGSNDLDGDRDGDGLSNRNEFLLVTDPTNPLSGVFIQIEIIGQSGINIHFPYLANHSYSILASDDLSNWTETPIEDFSFDSAGLAVWSDTSAGKATERFYRLSVQ